MHSRPLHGEHLPFTPAPARRKEFSGRSFRPSFLFLRESSHSRLAPRALGRHTSSCLGKGSSHAPPPVPLRASFPAFAPRGPRAERPARAAALTRGAAPHRSPRRARPPHDLLGT